MKKVLVLIGVTVFLTSCSGGGGGVSDLKNLPKITSPVITSGAAELKFTPNSVKVSEATTGLNFYGATAISFDHNSSRGMCEMLNLSKEAIDKAAQGDKILCYITNTITAPVNAGALKIGSGDPYDGNYHIVALDFGPTPPNPDMTHPVMKFKVVKDGDKITEFEMFMCNSTAGQSQYLDEKVNSDGTVSIIDIDKNRDQNGGNWKGQVTVSGKINDAGMFTQKTITSVSGDTGAGTDSCSNKQKVTFEQFSDSMRVSSYQVGQCPCSCPTPPCGCGDGTYSNQEFSVYQLIHGDSANLRELAMGDGSIKDHFAWGTSPSESWSGENTHPLSSWTSGDFYAVVNAGDYPTIDPTEEYNAIDFTGATAWDCTTGTSEGTMSVDMAALGAISVCGSLGLRDDTNNSDTWINCWDIIDNAH